VIDRTVFLFAGLNCSISIAAIALIYLELRNEIGSRHRGKTCEPARGYQGLTAAPAAVTDKADFLAHILATLHQVVIVRLGQQVQPFLNVDGAGKTVADQRAGDVVEGQADF